MDIGKRMAQISENLSANFDYHFLLFLYCYYYYYIYIYIYIYFFFFFFPYGYFRADWLMFKSDIPRLGPDQHGQVPVLRNLRPAREVG